MLEMIDREIQELEKEIQGLETAIKVAVGSGDFKKAGELTHSIYHLKMRILFKLEDRQIYE